MTISTDRDAPPRGADLAGAPKPAAGARPVGGGTDLNRFSVGADGKLYWDNELVVVKRRVRLSPWQMVGAVVVGVAALVIAASGAIHAAISAHDWMCSAKWTTTYCPPTLLPPPEPPPRVDLPI